MKYIVTLLVALALPACSNLTPDQQKQVGQTGSFLAQKAFDIALQTVVNAAVSPTDAGVKGNYLDSLAYGLRTQGMVGAADIKTLVDIWTPADKAHWTKLAAEIANLFQATRGLPEAERMELIAQGLNAAAEKARAAKG